MLVLLLIAVLVPFTVQAATYYASPSGAGTTCSTGSPCTTKDLLDKLTPGDTGILKNGTYTGDTGMLKWTGTFSGGACTVVKGGNSSAVVTIQAESDGLAILDAQFNREPINWRCVRYVVVEGVRLQNSSDYVVTLDNSSNNVFRRGSFWNASYYPNPNTTACPGAVYYNRHVMQITNNSNYVLIEDSIFGGYGRDLFNFYRSHHGIIQRSIMIGGGYARSGTIPGGCTSYSSSNHGEAMQVYESSDIVVANVISYGIGNWPGHPRFQPAGSNIWVASSGQFSLRNGYYGSIFMNVPWQAYYNSADDKSTDSSDNIQDSIFQDIVSYQSGAGLYIANGRSITVNRATFLRSGLGEGSVYSPYLTGLLLADARDPSFTASYLIKNSIIANGVNGCYALSNLQVGSALLQNSYLYGNTTNYESTCNARLNKSNVLTSPALTHISIAYPPDNTAGEGGTAAGADTRCRYVASFNGTAIVVNHTTESLWPLPASLNTRAATESLDIHGTSYDINALVLDALGPRDNAKIGCPNAAQPENPSTFVSSTGTNSISHSHNIPVGTKRVVVCPGMWHAGSNVGSVTGVTVGGQALALMSGGRVVTSPAFRAVEAWHLVNPPTGPQTVVVTTTGNVDGIAATSMAFMNSTTLGAVATTASLGGGPSVTAATNPGEEVVDCMVMSSTPTATMGPNQSFETQTAHPTQSLKLVTSTQSGDDGGLMTWTISSNTYYAQLAFSMAGDTPPPPATSTFRIRKYRFFSLFGTVDTPEVAKEPLGPLNTTINLSLGGSLRIRKEIIVEVQPSLPVGLALYCRKNADAYTQVTDVFGGNPVKFIGNAPFPRLPNPATATTQQLTSSPLTFTPGVVGRTTLLPITLTEIPTNNTTEVDWEIDTDPALTPGDTVSCETRRDSGATLGVHTVTPIFTIIPPRSIKGY